MNVFGSSSLNEEKAAREMIYDLLEAVERPPLDREIPFSPGNQNPVRDVVPKNLGHHGRPVPFLKGEDDLPAAFGGANPSPKN
jgi:hypothetical protein